MHFETSSYDELSREIKCLSISRDSKHYAISRLSI